jgi:3-deoxy-7-phosphoheptulonate synthase
MHAFDLSSRLGNYREVAQRPPWPDERALSEVTGKLRGLSALVSVDDVKQLRLEMARAARGQSFVLQLGDCAEPIDDEWPRRADAYMALTKELGDVISRQLGIPVVHIGRIAGQFAKPRSSPLETINGQVMHAYRGDLVNDPRPIPFARIPDCTRLLRGYRSAAQTLEWLRSNRSTAYCSHEALILEYEVALMRKVPGQQFWFAGSAHMLWIGERTRNPDGAHAAVMAETVNPLAVKVGATADVAEVIALVRRLNPDNEPGRITLITRMGSQEITRALPGLVEKVMCAGLAVGWICDPMHGNTKADPRSGKQRYLSDICREVEFFMRILREFGATASGLHLEASALARRECISGSDSGPDLPRGSLADRTLCDPRLDSEQAQEVIGVACRAYSSSVAAESQG